MDRGPALLFPGQDSFLPGVWAHLRGSDPTADEVMGTVDAVAADHGHPPVSPLLLDAEHPEQSGPTHGQGEQRQLAALATSLALARYLESAHHLAPGAVAGHGSGAFAALAAAGVLTAENATAALCERIAVLRAPELPPGGMLVLDTSRDGAEALLREIGEPDLATAEENTPWQTVISGPPPALTHAQKAADEAGVASTRLPSEHSLHHPALAPAAEALRERLHTIASRPARCLVYSATQQRFLPSEQDIADWLAADLTTTLSWVSVPEAMQGEEIDSYVECGSGDALVQWIRECRPGTMCAAPLARAATALEIKAALAPVTENTSTTPGESDAPGLPTIPASGELEAQVRALYVEELEYPEDVVTLDADLVVDLGVDSLQQNVLLERVLDQYQLSAPEVRATEFPTVRAVTELVEELGRRDRSEAEPA
ncbi:acyltransferase domain-containing protein [Streptomyces sp. NPDC088789]|uniref:acyltransferase domain-containing protein n=1 Tax=Streptomyces sp. NPDC088789 TaxID=3365899 RepID=UPI00381CB38C